LRVDERTVHEDDGAGGILERKRRYPVWFEAKASGSAPMTAALRRAKEELQAWCDAHPASYPPTVLHFTDGESTDGDPSAVAAEIRVSLFTSKGPAQLYNLHVSTGIGDAEVFPSSADGLDSPFARQLFAMSSLLTDWQIGLARLRYPDIGEGARGFIVNDDAVQVIDFFDVGTGGPLSPLDE